MTESLDEQPRKSTQAIQTGPDPDGLSLKLSNLQKMGYREMTVSELISHLAGLPPMMEIYSDSDGVSMFVNDTVIQQRENGPPYLRLLCSQLPKPPKPPSTESVEAQTARQTQTAMQLARDMQQSVTMPEGNTDDPRIDY